MQKNIAFYISDHNEEHILRNMPLLQNILKMESQVKIFVKSGKNQIEQIKDCLKADSRLSFFEMEMRDRDVAAWDDLAEQEKDFLRKEEIGLMVSDICPWIFIAADDLRIKSILVGNYTWADLTDDREEKEEYISCYELASHMFLYDLHKPEMTEYGVEYDLISMMNFPYNMEKIESLQKNQENPVVFVDVPGRETVDVSEYPYSFVALEGTGLTGENVTVLKKDAKEIHDYVAASTYVIGRASWTGIGRAVLANKKAAFYVAEEDQVTRFMIDLLKKRNQCIEMTESEWEKPGEILKKLEEFSYSYDHEYYNSDYDLARQILYAYPEKRRRNRS